MKKKRLNYLVLALAVASILFYCGNVFAFDEENISTDQESAIITSRFIAITSYYNNLTLNLGGKLTCEGATEVQDGYIAGVVIELQQYNGEWNTIKTWYSFDYDYVYLSRDWYVVSGYYYRLKLTHYALNEYWEIIETHTSYSSEVYY